jgi:uncharacterized membrane protein YeiB
LAVVLRNVKASDTSYTRLVVSRVAAAVLGGYVVTYWAGAAVAKAAIDWNLLSPVDAGMLSGLVQLVVYVALIIGVCAAASMRKAWMVLAALTALLAGVAVLMPGPPPVT